MPQKLLITLVCLTAVAGIALSLLVRESFILSNAGSTASAAGLNNNAPRQGAVLRRTDESSGSNVPNEIVSPSEGLITHSPSQSDALTAVMQIKDSQLNGITPSESIKIKEIKRQYTDFYSGWSKTYPLNYAALNSKVSQLNAQLSQGVGAQTLSSLGSQSPNNSPSQSTDAQGANSSTQDQTASASSSQGQGGGAEQAAAVPQEAPSAAHAGPSIATPIFYQMDESKLSQMGDAAASDINFLKQEYLNFYNTWAQQSPNNYRLWNQKVTEINYQIGQRLTDQALASILKN